MDDMSIKYFMDNDYKYAAIYDCQRSIPSIIDGLKPS